MKHRTKSIPLEQAQQQANVQQSEQETTRQFANAEEMLRYDAAQMTVPAAVAKRLQQSMGQVAAPKRSWWRRLFSK